MPLFSIIVPVYNAEKTLPKCLDSILSQTFPDFQVLMIENGSRDSSNTICRDYAARDSRFLLYCCESNCGPSGARNIGLENAQGNYITFIDSDDFVEPDYLESLCQGFRDADAVFFGYRQFSTDGTFLGEHIPSAVPNIGYREQLLQLHKQDMFGYTWIKAFRREIIGSFRFSQELNLLEDEVFACQVLSEPCRVAVLEEPLYNYITGNAGSLVGRTHPDYCRKLDVAYNTWMHFLQDYAHKDTALREMARAHVSRCMYYGFERDVDVASFFGYLAESRFFRDAALQDSFCDAVVSRNFRKLSRMRNAYRSKIILSRLLKRGRK